MKVRIPAKLNLSLYVTEKMPDGYHLLDSMMVSVGVYDEIEVLSAKDITVEFFGTHSDGIDPKNNTALRAAEFFCENSGINIGAKIKVTKNIPTRAGMGGPSADAAGVLRVLKKITNYKLQITNAGVISTEAEKSQQSNISSDCTKGVSAARTEPTVRRRTARVRSYCTATLREARRDNQMLYAQSVGADVPFMLSKPCQRVITRIQGIGEIIAERHSSPPLHFIILPELDGVSTKECFTFYDENPETAANCNAELITAIQNSRPLTGVLHNSLFAPAIRLNPKILDNYRLLGTVSQNVFMTGSGSACAALFYNGRECRAAYEKIIVAAPSAIITRSV